MSDARRSPVALLTAGLYLAVAACAGPSPPAPAAAAPAVAAEEPWFEEVAPRSGIDFVWVSGHRERHYLPEIMGGGAALFDMDDDGDLDAYLVQGGSLAGPARAGDVNRLYRNRGDGIFEDVTAGSGAGDPGYGMGVATGDYDGDGRVDLYVTNVGPNVLLRNLGDGRFEDVTAAAGVGDAGWGAGAAFVDHDLDGDLDLFVTNYLIWSPAGELDCSNDRGAADYCSPQAYDAPARDVLYRNDGGRFSDVTESAGMGYSPGSGLGVVSGDFDADGRPDLFIANDGMPDRLWVNLGGGRFEDRALLAGCAVDQDGSPKAGMGVAVADLDDDGDLDLLVCNLRQQSDSLYLNEGGYFADSTVVTGLGATSRAFTRFGMGWIDFDQDGRLDLYQANGRVTTHSSQFTDDPFAEPNLLFRGLPGPRFTEVLPRGGTPRPGVFTSRAAAFGDVDGDGGVDVLVVNRDAPVSLLRNRVAGRGHWIRFDVRGRAGSPALGATVLAEIGGRTVVRDVRSAYSYLAASDPAVHLGLGAETRAGDVRVRWPDGEVTHHGDQAADRTVLLQR